MKPQSRPLTSAELAAFRARQKSRSWALAGVLVALAALFFAITLVKMREESDNYSRDRRAEAAAAHRVQAKQGH